MATHLVVPVTKIDVCNINLMTINNLLEDTFDRKQNVEAIKFDVGPNLPYKRENIIASEYEIELTESPIYSILNLPSSITVKGDGDHEMVQKKNEIYLNNSYEKIKSVDNLTQNIMSQLKKEEEGCQTLILSKCTTGSQVNEFNLIDAYNETNKEQNESLNQQVQMSNKMNKYVPVQKDPKLFKDPEVFFNMVMVMERILAQNTLNGFSDEQRQLNNIIDQTEKLPVENKFILTYCFSLENKKNNLSVKCMHWHETETHLLAVAYSKLLYHDYEDKPTTVAVWSMKNPQNPERVFEFNESFITCLKFATENPNHLAIGFYNGELLIIDISSKILDVVFQKSKQIFLEKNSILDLFWTIQIVKNHEHECLVTCSFNGCIARYLYSYGTIVETIIIKISQVHTGLTEGEKNERSSVAKTNAIIATKFMGLNETTYLVGTGDGKVYKCSYENSMVYLTNTLAHYGIIQSLEKSPYDQDVYLTTGCDCCIKVWFGSVSIDPVITLYARKQIEKAIWSRTNPTVIASIIDNSIHIWDVRLILKNALVSVHKIQHSGDKFSNMEFTLDGKYLCVSNVSGTVIVYAWSNVLSTRESQEEKTLMYCIAESVYYMSGEELLIKQLSKERPEFGTYFSMLENNTEK
ncbi:WD40/YVTN repeat-like-containing domain,WD40-repeat-containing domain,WD40 repeat,WD40 repeat [Cinara cedri]|uniref:Dynein axonemal intermediate chain 4 n=1 Tax=Cinara cedri TaxID=506608 RepID=A0A5E4MWM7_9HEMI|nr:WD40/YVTN repeat-like-containing domain,WD40-repeat-containing domain,WD40 repeat,WD40 repeat [Cinara cedri]